MLHLAKVAIVTLIKLKASVKSIHSLSRGILGFTLYKSFFNNLYILVNIEYNRSEIEIAVVKALCTVHVKYEEGGLSLFEKAIYLINGRAIKVAAKFGMLKNLTALDLCKKFFSGIINVLAVISVPSSRTSSAGVDERESVVTRKKAVSHGGLSHSAGTYKHQRVTHYTLG